MKKVDLPLFVLQVLFMYFKIKVRVPKFLTIFSFGQTVFCYIFIDFEYSPARSKIPLSIFHKTLPRSSLQIHSISVRFYEMGDI